MTFPFKDVLGYQLQVFGGEICIALHCAHAPLLFVVVLPFRERNTFIQLSKNISLHCIYRFSTHEIIFFSQIKPHVYS